MLALPGSLAAATGTIGGDVDTCPWYRQEEYIYTNYLDRTYVIDRGINYLIITATRTSMLCLCKNRYFMCVCI